MNSKELSPENGARLLPCEGLFDSDGFGQITGLVNVGAVLEGNVVGEELAGDGVGDAGEGIANRGKKKGIGGDFVQMGSIVGSEGEDRAAPGFDLHEVAEHFVEGVPVAAHGDDGKIGVDEGDGPVLHLSGGITLSIDITDLLEFERRLETCGVHVVASEEKEVGIACILFGEAFDLFVAAENQINFFGEGEDFSEEGLAIFWGEGAEACHEESEEREHSDLGGKCLGGADADFRAGAEVEGTVGLAGEGGVAHVAEGENSGPFVFDFANGGDCVEGLSGLADGDDERIGSEDRVFIAEFRGDLGSGGNAGDVFKERGGDLSSMPGGSTGEDNDAAKCLEVGGSEGQVLEVDSAEVREQAVMESLLDGLGLLEDLLEHEMGIPVFGEGECAQLEALGVFLDGCETVVEHFDFVRTDESDLVIAEEQDIQVGFGKGVGVGGDKGFRKGGVDADGDGVFSGGCDDLIGVVFMDEGDTPEAPEAGEGLLHSGNDLSLIVMGDELGDHLTVCIGVEGPPCGLEHCTQFKVVFDDAVVDDGD